MYQGFLGYQARSAGTEPGARIRVNQGHIGWADTIFVMEKKHARILREKFGEALDGKTVICLHIKDIYRCMQQALIDELKAALSRHVEVAGVDDGQAASSVKTKGHGANPQNTPWPTHSPSKRIR